MGKFIGTILVSALLVIAVPTPTHAQYGGGGGTISGSKPGTIRSVPAPIQAFGGQVLGAFTVNDPATQAQLLALRTQTLGLMQQLLAMLQQQLAAAQAS